MSAILQVDFKI